jgi:hypothetical protein
MVWTAPKTFSANSALTAADLNTYLRDNFLETAPAIASTPGSYFITDTLNSVSERVPQSAYVATSGSISTSPAVGTYGDISGSVGPSVVVQTASRALVFLYCQGSHSAAHGTAYMSYAISGSTTFAPGGPNALNMSSTVAGMGQRWSAIILHDSLNPGANTFTAKYANNATGTATWQDRRIAVLPF